MRTKRFPSVNRIWRKQRKNGLEDISGWTSMPSGSWALTLTELLCAWSPQNRELGKCSGCRREQTAAPWLYYFAPIWTLYLQEFWRWMNSGLIAHRRSFLMIFRCLRTCAVRVIDSMPFGVIAVVICVTATCRTRTRFLNNSESARETEKSVPSQVRVVYS